MPCYHPIKGYRSKEVNSSGKRSVVFKPSQGFIDLPIEIPCNQCIGCRLERSRQWAVRCMHESQLHEENSFITLTFDDKHLDPDGSLQKVDFQKFMKRLRKNSNQKIRYFHCGEYGERNQRPHHHAILFGIDFPDKQLFSGTDAEHLLYTSEFLTNTWGMGLCTIGAVTFDSAAYVARYIMKKQTGEQGVKEYEEKNRIPPYVTMSRKPGIAYDFYNKFREDFYPDDYVTIRRDLKCLPPKFYDLKLENDCPNTFKEVKRKRIADAKKRSADSTPDRLRVREAIKIKKLKELERKIE